MAVILEIVDTSCLEKIISFGENIPAGINFDSVN